MEVVNMLYGVYWPLVPCESQVKVHEDQRGDVEEASRPRLIVSLALNVIEARLTKLRSGRYQCHGRYY